MEITGVTYSVSDYEHYNQNGDLNYFEEVIDAMILDGISGMNDTFRSAIRGLSRDKKRMTILSLLDKDLNLFKRIKALTDKNIGKMDHIKDIILMLREYVKVGEVEKKKFGEVMTPLELVKEMLATLPEEVWSNPNLKWLDPANGTGPYPIMVIYKLMIGLAEWEPDAEKRYKHIVENMIYVCELQPKNMFLYMCAVDPFDTYKLNIYTGSFLEPEFDKHMKDVWGVEKFDVVIGNPPFNQMIDMLFVQKSYKISDKVLFVHPSTWLLDEKGKQKKFNDTKNLIKEHLESIVLFNGNKLFGIQLFVPCVITYISKNKINKDIKCFDRINEETISYYNINDINKFSNLDVYPNLKNKISKILQNNVDKNKIFNISTKRNSTPGKIEKYSSLNTTGEFYVNIAQIRGHVDLNSDKNMLLNDFYTIVTRDNKVEREISNHMFFKFETENEAKNFLDYLKTDFARFCLSIYKNNSQLECGEMEFIPWLDFQRQWTDKDIIDFLKLSNEEVLFIKKIIPNYYE
jgi:hypothetical protein